MSIAVLATELAGESAGLEPQAFGRVPLYRHPFYSSWQAVRRTPDSCLIAFSTAGIACLVCGLTQARSRSIPSGSFYLEPDCLVPLTIAGYSMLGLARSIQRPRWSDFACHRATRLVDGDERT